MLTLSCEEDQQKTDTLLSEVIATVGDFTKDAIVITQADPTANPGPKIVWCNQAIVGITGYSRDELIGQTPRILQGENTSVETKRRITQKLHNWETVKEDILNYRKDGTEFWSELSIVPVADETGWYRLWVSVQRDVTERKRRELKLENLQDKLTESFASLAKMKERYDVAVAGSSVGLWDWDLQTDELFWSDRFKAIVGLEEGAFRPTLSEFTGRVHPDDAGHVERAIEAHLEDGDPFDTNYRLRREDGSYCWIHATGQAVWDQEGTPIRFAGSVRDISKDVAREKAIVEARRAAEASDEAKTRFLGNMSHELRTPLNGVLGFTQLLMRKETDPQKLEYLDLIKTSGENLLYLVNNILDLTQIASQQAAVNVSDFVLKDVTSFLDASVSLQARTKGLEFVLDLQLDPETVLRSDKDIICQILLNLTGNALKFTEKGEIRVCICRADEQLILRVKDTGVGIPEDQFEAIFDRFTQLDDSTSKNYQGAGLGLSIVKGLVESLMGTIDIESKVGAGTTFTVRVPVDTDPSDTDVI